MRDRIWERMAAATGIDFAVLIAAAAIVSEIKDINFAGELATATNEVFGIVSVLSGLAAFFLYWFTGTLAARMRQLEGGSGRLAAVVNGSGAFIASGIALAVGCIFAARNYGADDLAALATGILDGPTLMFPAAAYVAASGIVGMRAEGLPRYSEVLAQLSVPLGAAYLAGAGLQIFKYYAWINEAAYISFTLWVLAVSIIGVRRWTNMDDLVPVAPVRTPEPPLEPVLLEAEDTEIAPPRRPRPARKPAAKKKPAKRSTPRKR